MALSHTGDTRPSGPEPKALRSHPRSPGQRNPRPVRPGWCDERFASLPGADHLLHLRGQRLLFLFFGSPPGVLFFSAARLRLQEPLLGDPARLSVEVAVFLARVAHGLVAPFFATLPVPSDRYLPRAQGALNKQVTR